MTAEATTVAPNTAESQPSAARRFTLRERLLLQIVTWTCYLAIRLIGPTIRFAVSSEDGAPTSPHGLTGVFSFWHRCVFPAAWFFRDWGVRVMTSQSFDGEYIARIIQKFGFVAVRGSSSRGAVRALLGMRRAVEEGHIVAFTIDGPRGPRYVAKPGPVLLAKATGAPMGVFYIALSDVWVLNTWDAMMVPKPFSRALMRIGKPIQVPPDASGEEMDRLHRELQATLDRTRDFAESNVARAGTPDFPRYTGPRLPTRSANSGAAHD